MSDVPSPTSTPSLQPMPPLAVPPLPSGTPAGRPRVWQAALLFLAFGGLAGGSCAAFLSHPSGGSSDLWTLLFVAALPFAAGAFALLVFRLWRRRVAEAWPSVGQALLMGVAGAVLAAGGCGGWAATMEVSALVALSVALGATFVAGLALSIGAGELFLIALARLVMAPKR